MNIMINDVPINTDKKYVIATKYPYVLPAIIDDAKIGCICYNWRMATVFGDVLTTYTKLKQMDPTIPLIDDLVWLILEDRTILADYFIEDITDSRE